MPDGAAPDAQMLVRQRAVQPFRDAVALRLADPGGLVGDAFELEEQLVGVLIGRPQNWRPLSLSTASITAHVLRGPI